MCSNFFAYARKSSFSSFNSPSLEKRQIEKTSGESERERKEERQVDRTESLRKKKMENATSAEEENIKREQTVNDVLL